MTTPAFSAPCAHDSKTKGFPMFGIRRRRRHAAAIRATPAVAYGEPSGTSTTGHACSSVLDGMPRLESPLVTELIALQAHTRNLGWLSVREDCRDEYQHLGRLIIQHVLEGWQAQTRGRGRLEDLLLTDQPADLVQHSCQDDPVHTRIYGG